MEGAETAKLWRPRPESNRGARICSPLRNHSATWPKIKKLKRLKGVCTRTFSDLATELQPPPSFQRLPYHGSRLLVAALDDMAIHIEGDGRLAMA